MTGSFILDYFTLVFFASCGVFQMAAAYNGLRGLLFLQDRRLSFFLGLVLLAAAFAWFFLSGSRNLPDTHQGLNGYGQFGYFFAGFGAGLTFTLLVSSLSNRTLGEGHFRLPPGVDALRESNYIRALYRTLHPLLQSLVRHCETSNLRALYRTLQPILRPVVRQWKRS